MNNWKEVSLKDYCKTQYGYTASATDNNTGVKFVRITDIVPDFVDWNKVPYCEISEKDFKKYKLNEGDIVAARTGATVGYAKQIRKGSPDAVFASYLVKLIPSEKVDKHFLGVLIESNVYREFIQIIAGGSAQPNANANDLTLFKFFLPPLTTQQCIASILSAYDDLIEVNNQRIKLLEETARELYKEWFVRMRFPGYKQAKFVKGVPEGWEVVRIDSLYKTSSGGTPSREKPEYYDNGIYNWIKTGELNDSFVFETDEKISEIGLKKSSAKLFPPYATIFAMYGNTIGQLGITTMPSATNQACCALMPLTKEFDFEFLFLTLLLNRNEIISFGMGAAQQNVNQDELKKYKILKPTNDLAVKFKTITNPMFQQIQILQQQNTQLRQIRDRLLPRLISGKLCATL